jgi:AMIN domain
MTKHKSAKLLILELGKIILLSSVAIANFAPASLADTLQNWQFNPEKNQLKISLKDGTKPNYFVLSEPTRIVIDLPNTQLGKVNTKQLYNGNVTEVRLSQFQPNITRIVLQFSPEVSLNQQNITMIPESVNNDRWLIQPIISINTHPINNTLPPATFTNQQTPTVIVPSINAVTGEIFINNQRKINSMPEKIKFPVLRTADSLNLKKPQIITFGQTLPLTTEILIQPQIEPKIEPKIALNMVLNLRYTGEKPVKIEPGLLTQQMWQLKEDLQDNNGNIIAPKGANVSGKFISDKNQVKFIAENINFSDKNINFQGESLPINKNKKIGSSDILRNSALGALGGVLIGGEIGFFSGGAVGAATTYIITPEAITIEPGQILQVKVTKTE